jgi:hypothetical protein
MLKSFANHIGQDANKRLSLKPLSITYLKLCQGYDFLNYPLCIYSYQSGCYFPHVAHLLNTLSCISENHGKEFGVIPKIECYPDCIELSRTNIIYQWK